MEETTVGNNDVNASDNRTGNEEEIIMTVDDGLHEGMTNFNGTLDELPESLTADDNTWEDITAVLNSENTKQEMEELLNNNKTLVGDAIRFSP